MAKQEFLTKTNNQAPVGTAATFKVVFVLICSTFLICQTVNLIEEYFEYNTIIMVENDVYNSMVEFPSISICEKYPSIGVINGTVVFKYKFPIGNSIKLLKSNMMTKGDNTVVGYIEIGKYGQAGNKERIRNGYFNLTAKSNFAPFNDQTIKCSIFSDRQDCYAKMHAVSSVAQCRTYFSQIDSPGKVSQKMIRKLSKAETRETNNIMASFYINFTEGSYENVLPKGDLFVVVHDSKTFPNDRALVYASRRFLLKPNKNYDLLFNKKTTVKLPKPYKTDCFDYKEDINSSNIYGLSQELCSLKCRTEGILSKYNCLRYGSEVLYESDYVDSMICNVSLLMDTSDRSIYYHEYLKRQECYQKCKIECIQQVFNFELNEVDRSDGDIVNYCINATNDQNITLVTVMAKLFDDINYIHLPKMNFIDFWSSLGGLFSLWLGLSVIAVYDSLFALCVSLVQKI